VKEVGTESGVAFDGQGMLVAGMGVACGDFDSDGLLDLFVTHYYREMDTMYRNAGSLFFSDETARIGLGATSLAFLGFGTEFVDYDNDGWLDLAVANGHVLGPHHWLEAMRPHLYRNEEGRFRDVSDSAGEHFQRKFVARGLAGADFDNDGGVDLAVSNNDRPACVLKNVSPDRGNFLRLDFVGVCSNRSAVNARVTAHVGRRDLVREIIGGGSYQSASERRLVIGLGRRRGADAVEVRWPGGRVDHLGTLQAGDWLLVEGRLPRAAARSDGAEESRPSAASLSN
jgi:hypothetical protein